MFIPPLMFVLHPIIITEPLEPVINTDVVKALYPDDKSVVETLKSLKEQLTPKEYGIKKLTKKYKL